MRSKILGRTGIEHALEIARVELRHGHDHRQGGGRVRIADTPTCVEHRSREFPSLVPVGRGRTEHQFPGSSPNRFSTTGRIPVMPAFSARRSHGPAPTVPMAQLCTRSTSEGAATSPTSCGRIHSAEAEAAGRDSAIARGKVDTYH